MTTLLASTWRLAATNWVIPAAAIGALGLLLIASNYLRGPGSASTRILGAVLKIIGLALLLLCLLEPVVEDSSAKPGENLFVILADNSQSMRLRDGDTGKPRSARMGKLLGSPPAPASSWISRIESRFQLHRYLFDEHLRRATAFSELDYKGDATDLHAALRAINERYRTRPLAGILVLTDGAITEGASDVGKLEGLPPVYPVFVAGDQPARDAAVAGLTVSQSQFEDAPVTIAAAIEASGFKDRRLEVRLEDEAGELIEKQSIAIGADAATQSVQFRFKPRKVGMSFYHVRLSGAEDEATLENNHRTAAVYRESAIYRVLYVSGRPNWEFRFLNRAIEADEQVKLSALIRVAKREPKFKFRGKADGSNPLFEGFGKQNEDEAHRYDQPVLVRLKVDDPQAMREGFPKTPEDLYEYHAVILDDVEAGFFSHEQMLLLQRFVTDRGGGLLLLGGAESLGDGQYDRTPIGQMSPVYLDKLTPVPSQQSKLELTREGWLQPWARLRDKEPAERERIRQMPAFAVINRMGAAKPGASVIATVVGEGGAPMPALVVQRYGAGVCGVLAVGDMWRWALQGKEQGKDLARAWRQLVRFMVADAPHRVTLRAERAADTALGPVKLLCKVRDEKFEPMEQATVAMTVVEPDGHRARLSAEPSLAEAGVFEATYIPRQAGGFRAQAFVSDSAGKTIATAESGWAADPAADEFRALRPNRALLSRIAAGTGGEVIDADKLDAFSAGLPLRAAPIVESRTRPIWHTPWIFLLAILCLAGEWAVRRLRGLP